MIIQFTSIFVYLRANLTAQRAITNLARVRSKKQQKTYKQNIKYSSLYNNKEFTIVTNKRNPDTARTRWYDHSA
jgi:hypothetical protein